MAEQTDDTYFQQFLNERPTLQELCEHVRIGSKWYTFGVLLNLDIIELEAIRGIVEDRDFKALKMFELWLSSNPNVTRREVIETLQKEAIGASAVAEDYIKAFKIIKESILASSLAMPSFCLERKDLIAHLYLNDFVTHYASS